MFGKKRGFIEDRADYFKEASHERKISLSQSANIEGDEEQRWQTALSLRGTENSRLR